MVVLMGFFKKSFNKFWENTGGFTEGIPERTSGGTSGEILRRIY